MDKTMWIPILLITSLPGAVWAETYVTGVVGRAITIDCPYAAEYSSYTKHWCRGWSSSQCVVLVETNGQHERSGRVSITDHPALGMFTVTMEDLHSGDTGRYYCGFRSHSDNRFLDVYLQVSDEPVSVPVLGYLSPANVSRLGGSVLVSCESVRGSLPIDYTWYEEKGSELSTISNSNQLNLSCGILRGQHRRYYCRASNGRGTAYSEILNVKVFSEAGTCSYVTEINNIVSGAVWAESEVRGVVGRAITIDCHYAAVYRSDTKYWCRETNRQCAHVVETNSKLGQGGRVSFTDNPERGIFTVAVEDLHSGDTGWYSCGITAPGEPTFNVYLQVSVEPVSVPVLGYLSRANVSRLGGSVSVSCESARGSLPIQYKWYEKKQFPDSEISNSNQLDLSCEILRSQHHRFYCKASNNRGTESSEILIVKVFNGAGTCSYVTEINNTGALWAESEVRGVVGRAITIDCHYAAVYRSHTKYWCLGTSRQCAHVVETNGKHEQGGRVSITDNPARGIFTVAVEDLHSGDTGWYSCGINTTGEPTFNVHLQVSVEPVSVPVLGFLSPANVSCPGGWVSVSCESVRGSLPISYSWYENTSSVDSKISDNNTLDLHCQSFNHQHHQYYCKSSNQRGSKSSEMVNVSISSNGVSCSFLVKINGPGLEYTCETSKSSNYTSGIPYIIVPGVIVLLLILIVAFLWYRKRKTKGALWAKKYVSGVVGKNITIDCHYGARYSSHTKYWCQGWTHLCSVVVGTNGQLGRWERVSITDNPTKGKFTVTVEDLLPRDTGWYSCGITTRGPDTLVNIYLQVSDKPESTHELLTTVAFTSNTKVTSENNHQETTAPSFSNRYIIVLSIAGVLLVVMFACLLWCLKRRQRESEWNKPPRKYNNEMQELPAGKGSIVYATLSDLQRKKEACPCSNQNQTVYAGVQFQRKSTGTHLSTDEANVTCSDVTSQSVSQIARQKAPSPHNPQNTVQVIYATVTS
ncbi:polymeric immunoglobulin receptor-like isoform X1 [Rhinoraja longicauda]